MIWTQLNLYTPVPQLPKILNTNFLSFERYIDVFFDGSLGILTVPLETTGRIKGTRGEFVTAVVDNLIVKRQFTNLYDNNTTADYNFYRMYVDPVTVGRDPCTYGIDTSSWKFPYEPDGYKVIDVMKPYYKVTNANPIFLGNDNLSQVVGIYFDSSLIGTNPLEVLLDPCLGFKYVVDVSSAGAAYEEFIAIAYDPSWGSTWTQYKYGVEANASKWYAVEPINAADIFIPEASFNDAYFKWVGGLIEPSVQGGGGGGTVGWANDVVGSNNQLLTANGDGSIIAETSLYFTGVNLGIGTANPSSYLHVYGTGGTSPVFRVSGPGEQTWQVYNTNPTGATATSLKFASRHNPDWTWIWGTDDSNDGRNDFWLLNRVGGAKYVIYCASNGNIVLGDSGTPNYEPAERLSVIGDVSISGDLYVTGLDNTKTNYTIYYDTASKKLTYGTAPDASLNYLYNRLLDYWVFQIWNSAQDSSIVALRVSVNNASTFLGLYDTPDSYSAGKLVAVNDASTGLEFVPRIWRESNNEITVDDPCSNVLFYDYIELEADAGVATLIEKNITSSAGNTEQGYKFNLDGSTQLKVYGVANGSGALDGSQGIAVMNYFYIGDPALAPATNKCWRLYIADDSSNGKLMVEKRDTGGKWIESGKFE